MSRRDVIIVAVLINAGLLIVLFASAIKSSPPAQEMAMNTHAQVEELAVKPNAAVKSVDEIDQAIAKLAPQDFPASPQALTAAPGLSNINVPVVAASEPVNNYLPSAPSLPQVMAPVVAAPEKSESDFLEVKVKKGDVLEKIARHHRVSVSEIMKFNHLSNANLRIGQVLKIPGKRGAIASTSSAPTAQEAQGSQYYTVKNGDNPWTIAMKNHLKVEELLKLNNLDHDKAKRLKPGDQLRIR